MIILWINDDYSHQANLKYYKQSYIMKEVSVA